MAEKEVVNVIKLQIEAGKATPAPPVGPALGSSGVNIMQFVKEFNDKTADSIKKALKIEKGSGKPNKDKVAKITTEQVKAIAEQKMEDLNAASLEAAMSMVKGTARSMGVVVVD